jgi:DnaK suppressor protein
MANKIDISIPEKRENKHLKKTQLKILWESLCEIKGKIEQSLLHCNPQNYCLDKNELSDPLDEASINSETQKILRFRNRDIFLLKKISKSFDKIKDGTYGLCDECFNPISFERLKARPVADLCISCKEESELTENQSKKVSKSMGRELATSAKSVIQISS